MKIDSFDEWGYLSYINPKMLLSFSIALPGQGKMFSLEWRLLLRNHRLVFCLLLFACLKTAPSRGGSIENISTQPSAPTTNDSIVFEVEGIQAESRPFLDSSFYLLDETNHVLDIRFDYTGEAAPVVLPWEHHEMIEPLPAGEYSLQVNTIAVYHPEFPLLDGIIDTDSLIYSVSSQFPSGDFDNSGSTDGTDFLLWQRGESSNPLSTSDFNDWRTGYGTTAQLTVVQSIPEPASWILLLLSAINLASMRAQPIQPNSRVTPPTRPSGC